LKKTRKEETKKEGGNQPNKPIFRKRPSDLLSRAPDRTISLEHTAYRAIFRESWRAGTLGFLACWFLRILSDWFERLVGEDGGKEWGRSTAW
jgi:hypothetical protein